MKFRSNKIFLLLLVTAFLTVQWSATHIHLAEHHDHDGSHHQHNIQAHAHYTTNHHTDSIETAHEIGEYNVVEFDNDCVLSVCKKSGNQSLVSFSTVYQFLYAPQSTSLQLPELESNKQCYIAYSTIRLRAPPQFT